MAKSSIIKTYDYSDVPTILDFAMDMESFIKALMGPFGCIAGDTEIITEEGLLRISCIDRPMRVLSWNQRSGKFQLSLSGGAFPKGKDYLYRVQLPQGVFEGAGHHRVLCADNKYRRVDELQVGNSLALCCDNRLMTTSVFLTESSEDDRHCSGIYGGSPDRYEESVSPHDPQLLPSVDISPTFAPSQAGVRKLAYSCDSSAVSQMGVLEAPLQGHNHPGLSGDHRHTGGFCMNTGRRGVVVEDQACRRPCEHNGESNQQSGQPPQNYGCHHEDGLFPSYFDSNGYSISQWVILSIKRSSVKEIYWDMEVLNTNNYVTADGTIHHNSGKSSGCAVEISKTAQKQVPDSQGVRRTRWAVVRNSYPQLRDTSIKTFHYWFPPERCGVWRSTDHDYRMKWLMPDGTEINCEVLFRALDRPDHVKNLLSLELTGAWINEAREIAKPIIDAIQGRVGRFPAMQDGGCTWAGIIMDTNPPDTDSWWYKLFEEDKPANVKLYKQPSGRSKEAENLKNLPRNYYQNLMTGKDGEFIKVYIDGDYGYVQEGKPVYPNFRDSLHVAKEDLKAIIGVPLILGWDFGLTPACVIGQLSPRGCLNILHEFVSDNMGIRTLARQVVKPYLLTHHRRWFEQGQVVSVGDWAGNARAETDEKTCFMELKDAGIPSIMARTNNIVARTQAVDTFLSRLVDGKAGFQLSPSCRMLRKGFNGAYRYKRMQIVGEDRFQNSPEKNIYSHVHDAIQYLALSADQDIQSAERNVRTKDQYTNIMQGTFVNFGGHI